MSIALVMLTVTQAPAERLALGFLPPDLPPSNICNADPERFESDETQIVEDEDASGQILEDAVRLQYLSRDISLYQRNDPEGAFDFIMALISRRAELDPGYAGFEESFDRIDTYLAAGRVEDLRKSRLIPSLAANVDEMSWSQTVRLSRYYLNGIGVDKDRDFAMQLIVDQAYFGNANALLEVLRMQMRGEDVGTWGLTKTETARLAFGGMVGRLNAGLCARAERMAREYVDGDFLLPNPELAYAWRKFAADMGGAEAAWRVVEHHLSANGVERNTAVLRHYLQKAVQNGFVVLPDTIDDIVESGAKTETEVRRILGKNHIRVGTATRLSAVRYLTLDAQITTPDLAEQSERLDYLREISLLPSVPGKVLTDLANEILLREGRWKGRAEAMPLLRQGIRRGDAEAAVLLAELLLSDGPSTSGAEEAQELLIRAVELHRHVEAMESLDALYRCKLPGAPHIDEATFWADAYRATGSEPVSVSVTDLASLDARSEPEVVARLQTLANRGHGGSSADWLQFLQSDTTTSPIALRHWADRVARSDIALERYALGEFELALTLEERRSAVGVLRRVYLDLGAAVALDLAVTLIEDLGRDSVVADEILELLGNSARRGEGAAIRLLQRLTGRDEADVLREFGKVIEDRGDFVALAWAAPLVDERTYATYMARAVSIMSCKTKDVTELIEAAARRGDSDTVVHWVQVGLAIDGGNSLMKLGLSDQQVADFDRGISIAQDMLSRPRFSADDFDNNRLLYLAAADPAAPEYRPEQAGQILVDLIEATDPDASKWALLQYREATQDIRQIVDSQFDIQDHLREIAEAGDTNAQYELGMVLRSVATDSDGLRASTEWLGKAANAGHAEAIVEYAFAIGLGVGREADPKLALIWLDRASRLNAGRGTELRALFSAMVSE